MFFSTVNVIQIPKSSFIYYHHISREYLSMFYLILFIAIAQEGPFLYIRKYALFSVKS